MFQVGDLTGYENDDPVFDSKQKAIGYAVKEFEFWDQPIGIWVKGDGELVAIYHQGELFTK